MNEIAITSVWIENQREILIYVLAVSYVVVFLGIVILSALGLRQNSDSFEVKRRDAYRQTFELLVTLLMIISVLLVHIDWIYVVFVFILGPRIASENYLINIIRAWKTSRREESKEIYNPRVSTSPIRSKMNKYE